jgi:Heterokaryon incompatibility protein (HET)
MASAYKYLKKNHIRLLAVSLTSNVRHMHFKFMHVPVNSAIPYTAVSYAWNHGAGDETIVVDGQVLHIKRNLWKCLQSLKQTWPCIWADAICIDQHDIDERNYQVSIMSKIFANAAVVSVWLGGLVQDHISQNEAIYQNSACRKPGVHKRTVVPPLASFMVDHAVATLDDDDLAVDLTHSIDHIAQAPYWCRVWVVQEFLLARKVHLYYGDAQIDESVFSSVLFEQIGLDPHKTTLRDVLSQEKLLKEWPPLALVLERQPVTPVPVKRPYYDLLVAHRDAKCLDRRDMLFSLLSLICPEERILLERSFPDYDVEFMTVAFVVLAHLRVFAGDRPLHPVIQALDLKNELEDRGILLLFHLLPSFDYIHSTDPGDDADYMIGKVRKEAGHGQGIYVRM